MVMNYALKEYELGNDRMKNNDVSKEILKNDYINGDGVCLD